MEPEAPWSVQASTTPHTRRNKRTVPEALEQCRMRFGMS